MTELETELLAALKLARSILGAEHGFTIGDIWNAQQKADAVIKAAEGVTE